MTTIELTIERVLELLLDLHIIREVELGYVYQTDENGAVWSKTRAARAIASLFHKPRPSLGLFRRRIDEATREHLIKWPEYESGSPKYTPGACDRLELIDRLLDVDLSRATLAERRQLSRALKRFLTCGCEERGAMLLKTRLYVKKRLGHLLKSDVSDQTPSFQVEDMTEAIRSLSKSYPFQSFQSL